MRNVRGKTGEIDPGRVLLNYAKRKGKVRLHAPPYANVAVCWACGKRKHVNIYGFCKDCWDKYSYTRKAKG